jgi:hypothetical protein
MRTYRHTTVTRVRAGTPGVKAVYVVRHKDAVVGRYLSPKAAHRRAAAVDGDGAGDLVGYVQQPFAIGLFRDMKDA